MIVSVVFILLSLNCLFLPTTNAALSASQIQNLIQAGLLAGSSVQKLIGQISTCGKMCWHNDWAHRDDVANKLNMYDWRCSSSYTWGGRCYCVGPPHCGCGENCYNGDWQRRDNEAKAAGVYNTQRCSFDNMDGGRCYCWGKRCL